MVICPLLIRWQFSGNASGIEIFVHIETNLARFPFRREHMEVIGEILLLRQAVWGPNTSCTRVAGTVDCPMYGRRLFPNIFHDVDLAAIGPANLLDVCT